MLAFGSVGCGILERPGAAGGEAVTGAYCDDDEGGGGGAPKLSVVGPAFALGGEYEDVDVVDGCVLCVAAAFMVGGGMLNCGGGAVTLLVPGIDDAAAVGGAVAVAVATLGAWPGCGGGGPPDAAAEGAGCAAWVGGIGRAPG